MEHGSNGIGLCGILLVVFIILKLVGTIDWSWWWVLGPLWIPFAFYCIVFFIYLIIVFLKA